MNTETRFTPGPWYADDQGRVWRRTPGELYENGGGVAGDFPLATTHIGRSTWENKYPHVSNARLIAASPDMYAALKDAREYVMELLSMRNLQSVGYTRHGQIPIIEECLENIDAALTKAEGQS